MSTLNKSKDKRHKYLFRIAFILLAVAGAYIFLYSWYFWSSAGRSPDRYGVLQAMLKLRFSNQQIVRVSGRPDLLLAHSTLDDNQALKTYLSPMSWKFVDRGGAVSYFRKSNQKMEITHLSMTRFFMCHKLKPKP